MSLTGANWEDLGPRVTSALVMVGLGAVGLVLGGLAFALLVAVATGLMIWEISRLTAPRAMLDAVGLGAGAALCVLIDWTFGGVTFAFLALPALALGLTPRRDAKLDAGWALATMLSAHVLLSLRDEAGIWGVLWLLLIVIASDTAGYFAGRHFGGPKFWPAISPKKTWSGTLAGWAGAVLVGLLFWLLGPGGWGLVFLSPLLALAGQMGDITESLIKRRAGVKDASHLIPGHGGVMDRFDALTGAAVALFVASPLVGWPVGG